MPKHPVCCALQKFLLVAAAGAGIPHAAGRFPGIAQEQQRDDDKEVIPANSVADVLEDGTIVAEEDQQDDNPPPVAKTSITARIETAHTKSLLVF